jgi:PAS domain S-box-containing protein
MSQSGVPEPNQQSSSSKSVAETLLSPSILEAVPDAVTVVNRQGVIIQANSQTETLFACTRDELIGPRIEILVLERQRPEHDRQREQFHSKSKIRRMGSGLDLYGRRRDGSEFPVEISLSPVSTPDGTMVLSVIRDISDCKHIEEELRRVNELRDSQNRLALIVDSWHDAIIGKQPRRHCYALE